MKGVVATTLCLACLAVALAISGSSDLPAPALFQAVAQAGSEQPSASPQSQFKQRHAALGIECTACHVDEAFAPPPMNTCFQCHGSYEDVAERTSSVIPNPHHSHMGEVACGECHKEHSEPRLSCNQCHVFDMSVP